LIHLILLLQQQGSDGITGILGSLLPFILIIAVFYFLILRPQQKRQKERQKLLEAVQKGDKVITAQGIHGTIDFIDTETNTVFVKIADNVKVKMEKSSIGTIVGVTDVKDNKGKK